MCRFHDDGDDYWPDWASDELQEELDAARARIESLEKLAMGWKTAAHDYAAKYVERGDALRAAHSALALVHRGLVQGHIKARAIVPREGPIVSLDERVAQAMLAVSAALTPAA